jgi:hypothetical protein
METQRQEFRDMDIVKFHNLISQLGGYTRLLFLPIEFSRDLDSNWVEVFKKKYEKISKSRSEDIVFQPADTDFPAWDQMDAPLERTLLVTINAPTPEEADPVPEKAREWVNLAVREANIEFGSQACCAKNRIERSDGPDLYII